MFELGGWITCLLIGLGAWYHDARMVSMLERVLDVDKRFVDEMKAFYRPPTIAPRPQLVEATGGLFPGKPLKRVDRTSFLNDDYSNRDEEEATMEMLRAKKSGLKVETGIDGETVVFQEGA